MQKSVVSLSAVRYTACSAFAIPRHVTGSQTVQTQSELLNMLSSFQYFHRLELLTGPNRVFSVLEGTSGVARFACVFCVRSKRTRLRLIGDLKFVSVKRRVCLC